MAVHVRLSVDGTADSLADLQLALDYLTQHQQIDQATVTHDDSTLTVHAVSVEMPWEPTPPGTPS